MATWGIYVSRIRYFLAITVQNGLRFVQHDKFMFFCHLYLIMHKQNHMYICDQNIFWSLRPQQFSVCRNISRPEFTRRIKSISSYLRAAAIPFLCTSPLVKIMFVYSASQYSLWRKRIWLDKQMSK